MFSRTSAYFRSEKKMAAEEGNWPTSLLLVPSPFSFFIFYPFLPLRPRETGQTRREQVVRDVDDEIDQNLDLQPQENDNSSDVEQFADEDEEGDDEGSRTMKRLMHM